MPPHMRSSSRRNPYWRPNIKPKRPPIEQSYADKEREINSLMKRATPLLAEMHTLPITVTYDNMRLYSREPAVIIKDLKVLRRDIMSSTVKDDPRITEVYKTLQTDAKKVRPLSEYMRQSRNDGVSLRDQIYDP